MHTAADLLAKLPLLPREDLVSLCQALIRTPSVNGEHPEQAVAAVVADFAHAAGLPVITSAAEPGRPGRYLLLPRQPGEDEAFLRSARA